MNPKLIYVLAKKLLNVTFVLLLVNYSALAQIHTFSINQTLIGPGQINLDIDSNSTNDFSFDIITLSAGVFAARVDALGSSAILDNSTFGYPDTLNYNDDVTGYFHTGIGVLGTFNNAGQFNGVGNKYLGIKINTGSSNFYGWIELNCSLNRDTLNIISCGYNSTSNGSIKAGQTTIDGIVQLQKSESDLTIYPNPSNGIFTLISTFNQNSFELFNARGEKVILTEVIRVNNYIQLNLSKEEKGIYFLKNQAEGKIFTKKLIIQ